MIEGKLGLDMGDFECRYCSFKSLCWSDKPEEIVPEKKYLYKLSDKSDLIIPGEPKTIAPVEPVDNDYI